MKIAATLSLLATASAFAPASKPARATVAVQETKVSIIVVDPSLLMLRHSNAIPPPSDLG
jgi:hypothetical protein